MDTYQAVVAKRDQRAFLPRPIPEEALRRDRARLGGLAALGRFARWMADAAVASVIVQSSMVAAWGEGIGSCPAHLPEAELARLLGIPPGLEINRVIGFGYVDPARAAPPGSVARRRLPLEELVHWESW